MNIKEYYVYILSSKRNGTLYIGVTNNIEARIQQHKEGTVSSFTSKYAITNLVYYESFPYIDQAIQREKQLKNWKRAWKIELIEQHNFSWEDLGRDWNEPSCDGIAWVPGQAQDDQ